MTPEVETACYIYFFNGKTASYISDDRIEIWFLKDPECSAALPKIAVEIIIVYPPALNNTNAMIAFLNIKFNEKSYK